MTAPSTLSRDDAPTLDFLDLDGPGPGERDALTPGAPAPMEALGRPWRLGLVGLGVALSLVARLAAANGLVALTGNYVNVSNGLAMAIGGIGLLAAADRRDPLRGSGWLLASTTAVAAACAGWVSPTFRATTTGWDNAQQLTMAIVGLGAGLVLAGVLATALIRRSPTASVALLALSGVFLLAANTVLRGVEWPAIGLVAAAFAAVLAAWDRSPFHEVVFSESGAPRAVRAALSFTTITIAGFAIQHRLSSDTEIPRSGPAFVLAIALVVGAFVALWMLRSEVQRRANPLSDWASWMREIRTNEFRGGLAELGATEPLPGLATEQDVTLGFDDLVDLASDDLDTNLSSLAPPGAETDQPTSNFARDLEIASAAKTSAALDADTSIAVSAGGPSAFSALIATRGAADAELDSSAVTAVPASEQLTAASPSVTPQDLGVSDTAALAEWLNSSSVAGADRSFIAIEALPIAPFDELHTKAQTGLVTAVARHMAALDPAPAVVAWLDGPYFMLAIDDPNATAIADLNRHLQPLLSARLTFTNSAVDLDGTLAILRSSDELDLDTLLSDAVEGLRQARTIQTSYRNR